jgi:macrolide-specific efflux system membrane fusion protein
MKLKILLTALLFVAGCGAIFISLGGLSAQAAGATYLTSAAVVGDINDDVAATGSIVPAASYGLAFGSAAHLADDASSSSATGAGSWHVDSVAVAVGDRVKKDQTLAVGATTDLMGQLRMATASRQSAALQLTIATENLADASGTDATRQAQISVYNAENQLAQAEADERDLSAQIKAATLIAPVDGIVTAVNIVAGFDAPSGDAIVIATDSYQVTANVVESDVSSISVGQDASVAVAAIGADVAGAVAAIAPVSTSSDSGGVVSYAVTIKLGQAPAELRSGMTADITITTASATNVLTVPIAALTGSEGAYRVEVLDAAGVPQPRQVEVGLVTSSAAEITNGLTAGELVVTGTASQRTTTTTTTTQAGPGGLGGFGGGGAGGGGPRGGSQP